MDEEDKLAQEAINYIKSKKNEIIEKFASPSVFLSAKIPISVFMAGSPGAGKTEFSKGLLASFEKKDQKKVIHIDADNIRDILPGYNGKNSYIFQGACSIGVDKLYDSVLKNKQNFILDGTFANFEKAHINIERSLRRERGVSIIYLYQEPLVAWDFTKKREKLDGRYMPKEAFITQLFAAKANVNKVKKIFGNKVQIYLIEKDYKTGLIKTKFNIDSIDNYISINYSEDELKRQLL